ncbi:MAG: glycosyltransferase family 39 protein, partial [Chloroflexota bacterium]|nr:glycosyltransferase family 39 protein [Chloroflexota bacterium]
MSRAAEAAEDGRDVLQTSDMSGNGSRRRPETEPAAEPSTPLPQEPVDAAPRFSLVSIGLFCVVLAGLLLRFSMAQSLSSHVDESASIMAIKMVADKGVPVFPSGTLYLQGATISYLLAPVALLGYGGLENLEELRLLSVVAGTLAILAVFYLTRWLLRNEWTALAVAAALAFDPASVRWGGMVRMYALLQLSALIMLFFFLKLLRAPGSRLTIAAFVASFWFGVFTHIAICLFLPPMLILAAWKHRWD